MGTRGTHASDGTPRCSEPQQDAAGNWFCPACGRAEGFKSKMAVLGHLRSCRPGKPAIRDLLDPKPAKAAPSPVYLPTPNEAAQINGMGAILSRLDQMAAVQAQHSKALGNHIEHLSAKAVPAAPPPPAASSWSLDSVVKWGGLAVLGLSLVDRLAPARASSAFASVFPPSESVRRMAAKKARFDASRCAAQWKAKAEGEEIEIDPECLAVDEEPPARRRPVAVMKDIAGLARDFSTTLKAVKSLS
jgi:hypothetical protein